MRGRKETRVGEREKRERETEYTRERKDERERKGEKVGRGKSRDRDIQTDSQRRERGRDYIYSKNTISLFHTLHMQKKLPRNNHTDNYTQEDMPISLPRPGRRGDTI